MQDQSDDQINACYNPCSSSFDPQLVLTSSVTPGIDDVSPLASINQFEEYHSDPELFKKTQEERKQKDELRKAAKLKSKDAEEANTSAQRKPTIKNVITRMEHSRGPLSCLLKWMKSRTRVKVVTRTFRSVRGSCTGFVEAFDKYLNLAMVDVDELYSSLRNPANHQTKKRGRNAKSTNDNTEDKQCYTDPEAELLVKRVESLRLMPCNNIKRRHINQLFIRGDNVVSINAYT